MEYLLAQGQPVIQVPKAPVPQIAGEWKTFYTKLAGVTYRNADGSDRQRLINRCSPGEQVHLVREPDNQIDQFAVRVVLASGEQLGYLSGGVVGNGTSAG